MAEIRTRVATDEYRKGWDKTFAVDRPATVENLITLDDGLSERILNAALGHKDAVPHPQGR